MWREMRGRELSQNLKHYILSILNARHDTKEGGTCKLAGIMNVFPQLMFLFLMSRRCLVDSNQYSILSVSEKTVQI